jgi:hypothetical protein
MRVVSWAVSVAFCEKGKLGRVYDNDTQDESGMLEAVVPWIRLLLVMNGGTNHDSVLCARVPVCEFTYGGLRG